MSGAEDSDLLAGEYVLGVLDAPQMRQAAGRALSDAGFAAQIRWWEQRLAPLADRLTPVAPPTDLWTRISTSVDRVGAAPVRRGSSPVRRWQVATAAALAMAAAFAAIAFLPRPYAPSTVAALAPLNAPAPAFVVRALSDGRLQVVSLGVAHVPSDRDLQLWALPVGATRPVSLGVLPAAGTVIAAGQLTEPGGKLLVSLEPKGGSPTGQPTGAVLYGGTIARL